MVSDMTLKNTDKPPMKFAPSGRPGRSAPAAPPTVDSEAGGVSGIIARLESARVEAARAAARKAERADAGTAGDGGAAIAVDSVDAIAAQLALGSDDVEMIRIRGARQHNLKNIDLEIRHNAITVITGVSGSGKSSLAF